MRNINKQLGSKIRRDLRLQTRSQIGHNLYWKLWSNLRSSNYSYLQISIDDIN